MNRSSDPVTLKARQAFHRRKIMTLGQVAEFIHSVREKTPYFLRGDQVDGRNGDRLSKLQAS